MKAGILIDNGRGRLKASYLSGKTSAESYLVSHIFADFFSSPSFSSQIFRLWLKLQRTKILAD